MCLLMLVSESFIINFQIYFFFFFLEKVQHYIIVVSYFLESKSNGV